MAIPDFQTIMRPLLEVASDGKQHSNRDAREALARTFKLTEDEKNALLPSGRQGIFVNRVAWAKAYLQQAGLLDTPQRGHFKITERGRQALNDVPDRITIGFLQRFPEFAEFRSPTRKPKAPQLEPNTEEEERTPEETLEAAHLRLHADLAAELLSRVKRSSPRFFEHLVVELLLKMGYGGSREEAGGPEIQKFVGALHGKRAKKGVFITTGSFSADARDYVKNIEPKVVLIDGRQLAELMIDFNVGVDSVISYQVKRITSDYFDEE